MATPSNPEGWRDLLNDALDRRWSVWKIYDAYYEGDQSLAFITQKYRDAYGGFFKGLTDNWCQMVVDAPSERLSVQGFRFDNEDADDDAWEMWQANDLDAASVQVHDEAIKLGESYWMVEPNGEMPRITAEHPAQVIVYGDPSDRRQRLAAFKKWQDGDEVFGNIYLPDRVVKYRSDARSLTINPKAQRWETIGAVSNPLGVVPVVPLPNRPHMLRGGVSDLKGGPISLQNAINLLLSTQLIGAEYMAYPLRVLLGVDAPRGRDGEVIENAEMKVSQSRLMMFPGDAREMDIKELSAADLSNMREAIDGLVRDFTAQTRTPPHYVAGEIVNASADALKAAETGLTSKVRKKMPPIAEGHEETMRLAFKARDASDERADSVSAETIWRDPETRSDAERVDAATKLQAIGVPNEVLWEKVGFTPKEIERMQVMIEAEALLNPAPPAPEPGQNAPAEQNGQVPPEQVPAP